MFVVLHSVLFDHCMVRCCRFCASSDNREARCEEFQFLQLLRGCAAVMDDNVLPQSHCKQHPSCLYGKANTTNDSKAGRPAYNAHHVLVCANSLCIAKTIRANGCDEENLLPKKSVEC